MPELCDPYVYYRRVRPYIHGWKDHPLLPAGVTYEGVAAFAGRPQRLRGETGAQSGIVPALDAALGVEHAADPLRAYLAEMRDYMPPRHRAFLEAVETAPSIRAAALRSADRELRAAYDECLRWLEAFRSTHLDYAARYIHHQSSAGAANPTGVGTGGTPFMAYLRKHRDETSGHRV
jgi:indoleamine 2,3-dioxygenase